jgi:predicted hydrocarbon binding protein
LYKEINNKKAASSAFAEIVKKKNSYMFDELVYFFSLWNKQEKESN